MVQTGPDRATRIMKMPPYNSWNIWINVGFFRLFVFWADAWIGFVDPRLMCPETLLPRLFEADSLEATFFASLLVCDTLLFGYLVTVFSGLVRAWRQRQAV